MTRKCYQLSFTGPLHLSSGGFALEGIDSYLRSDTLYSALCSTAAAYWNDAVRLRDFFFPVNGEVSPRFRLSSGFPYFQDIFFLPKPYFYQPQSSVDYAQKKRLNKVRFVDSLLWEDMVTGKSGDVIFFSEKLDPSGKGSQNALVSSIINGCWTNQSVLIRDENLHPEERLQKEKLKENIFANRFFEEIERPRLTVDRVSSEATIFHFGEIIFRRGAGLYFLTDFDRDEDVAPFEALLTMLGEQGLGADRTVGRGMFEWDAVAPPVATLPLSGPSTMDSFISLSLFVPSDDELSEVDFTASWYDFTLRRGWVSHRELRRRAFRMFTEGSAFKTKKAYTPKGKLLKALHKGESNLSHDVWRSGLCFAVPAILPPHL